MAIGVAAFIAMVAFGRGARSAVVGQFEKLGVNILSIAPSGLRPGGRPPSPLTDRDANALEAADAVDYVAPVLGGRTFLIRGNVQRATTLRATNERFVELRDWPLAHGANMDALDLERKAPVCILGATPARKLFPDREPVGATVSVEGKLSCRVIGRLSPKGAATSGRDVDDVVLIPASTYFARVRSGGAYGTIDLRPTPGYDRAAAMAAVRTALRKAHRLPENAEDDFVIRSSDDAIIVASTVSDILTVLLASIAAVSLLVGGIGIMNIQLVAVAERTREIGIRAAIGATPQQILRQFLAESVVLALFGTVLGTTTGVGLAWGVARAMRWSDALSLGPILLSVAFGAAVGVFFGYLPAARAARLDPIEALRRE